MQREIEKRPVKFKDVWSLSVTIPGYAQPKQRPRIVKRGSFARGITPKETANHESYIKFLAAAEMQKLGLKTFEGPVFVQVRIYRAIPKSASKKKKEQMRRGEIRPATRPDLDNQIKTIFDALNGVCFKDDGQIVCIVSDKFYDDGEGERCEILVRQWVFEEGIF